MAPVPDRNLKHKRRFCRVPNCGRIVKSQGLCQRHGAKTRKCKIKDCSKQAQGNFDGMCKSHFKLTRKELIAPIKPLSSEPPPPTGESVYDRIIPESVAWDGTGTMPLVRHLKEGFDENRPRGWHRNDERLARGMHEVQNPAVQLEGWERELVWLEICMLSGNDQAHFRHLARAWARDKGFQNVLAQFICERQGDVERKKRIKKKSGTDDDGSHAGSSVNTGSVSSSTTEISRRARFLSQEGNGEHYTGLPENFDFDVLETGAYNLGSTNSLSTWMEDPTASFSKSQVSALLGQFGEEADSESSTAMVNGGGKFTAMKNSRKRSSSQMSAKRAKPPASLQIQKRSYPPGAHQSQQPQSTAPPQQVAYSTAPAVMYAPGPSPIIYAGASGGASVMAQPASASQNTAASVNGHHVPMLQSTPPAAAVPVQGVASAAAPVQLVPIATPAQTAPVVPPQQQQTAPVQGMAAAPMMQTTPAPSHVLVSAAPQTQSMPATTGPVVLAPAPAPIQTVAAPPPAMVPAAQQMSAAPMPSRQMAHQMLPAAAPMPSQMVQAMAPQQMVPAPGPAPTQQMVRAQGPGAPQPMVQAPAPIATQQIVQSPVPAQQIVQAPGAMPAQQMVQAQAPVPAQQIVQASAPLPAQHTVQAPAPLGAQQMVQAPAPLPAQQMVASPQMVQAPAPSMTTQHMVQAPAPVGTQSVVQGPAPVAAPQQMIQAPPPIATQQIVPAPASVMMAPAPAAHNVTAPRVMQQAMLSSPAPNMQQHQLVPAQSVAAQPMMQQQLVHAATTTAQERMPTSLLQHGFAADAPAQTRQVLVAPNTPTPSQPTAEDYNEISETMLTPTTAKQIATMDQSSCAQVVYTPAPFPQTTAPPAQPRGAAQQQHYHAPGLATANQQTSAPYKEATAPTYMSASPTTDAIVQQTVTESLHQHHQQPLRRQKQRRQQQQHSIYAPNATADSRDSAAPLLPAHTTEMTHVTHDQLLMEDPSAMEPNPVPTVPAGMRPPHHHHAPLEQKHPPPAKDPVTAR